MKHLILLLLLSAVIPSYSYPLSSPSLEKRAGEGSIIISNPTELQRQELIQIPAKELYEHLGIKYGAPVVVLNSALIEQDVQLTHDGYLLFDVSVTPHGTARYTVKAGIPQAMLSNPCDPPRSPLKGEEGSVFSSPLRGERGGSWASWSSSTRVWTSGRLYPDRLDDIAWENDRGAYRIYGPAFQKSGSIGYGIDVWSKNTIEPDIDSRFRKELDVKATMRFLREYGYKEEADSLGRNHSFHLDHGTGNDVYAVGPTLGCGGAAIVLSSPLGGNEGGLTLGGNEGGLLPPNCWQQYEILDNGPLRFTVSLDYGIVPGTNLHEYRTISLDKGSNFNKIEVTYVHDTSSPLGGIEGGLTLGGTEGGLEGGLDGSLEALDKAPSLQGGRGESLLLCTGFPLHAPNESTLVIGDRYMQYADPTDRPEANTCELYIACLYPNIEDIKITTAPLTSAIDGTGGIPHAIAYHPLVDGKVFTYYAGSAWSRHDVRNQQEWQVRVTTTLQALETPLQITLR